MSRFILSCALFVSCAAVQPTLAFNAAGHQTVGAIADRLLAGTHAERKVQQILGSNLQTAAVWADCVKGVSQVDGRFVYTISLQFPECRPFESKAEQARMIDFVERNWTNCNPAPGADRCHKQYHYTDVAIQRDAYASNLTGTSGHDVVAALNASIAVLQGKPSPAPFALDGSSKDALRLLSHCLGDIHQPLHVVAVYLDAEGRPVDPDAGPFDPESKTIGGNNILDGLERLHAVWDVIPQELRAGRFAHAGAVEARSVPASSGPLAAWPAEWASDTLRVGKSAFSNLVYSRRDAQRQWQVRLPDGYGEMKADIQRQQMIKAGARLAEVLRAIWP